MAELPLSLFYQGEYIFISAFDVSPPCRRAILPYCGARQLRIYVCRQVAPSWECGLVHKTFPLSELLALGFRL